MQGNSFYLRRLLVCCILIVCGQGLFAQSVSIQGELDKSEMMTGEQASVNLVIRTDNLPQTRFRLSNDAGERRFEVLELGALDTTKLDDKLLEIKARLLITSFDSTLVRIPPIIVETPNAVDSTESFAINIIQPKVDVSKPNDFKEIKSPWTVELTWRDIVQVITESIYFWIIIILLFTLLLAYLLYRWYVKNKRLSVQEAAPLIVLTSIEKFERAITLIQEQRCLEQENYKMYYTLLIEAMKSFLDEEMSWTTMEQTSNEVLETLQEANYTRKELNPVEDVFRLADLSKFAKSKPSRDEAEESMNIIRRFCQELYQEQVAKRAIEEKEYSQLNENADLK